MGRLSSRGRRSATSPSVAPRWRMCRRPSTRASPTSRRTSSRRRRRPTSSSRCSCRTWCRTARASSSRSSSSRGRTAPPSRAPTSWTPNSAKLASEVGVKLASYSEDWYGNEVDVVEMDDAVDKLEEIIYLESQMCNTGTKFYGELTEQIVKNEDAPGSDNGTGLMQTLCSFKIREVYEKLTAK